MSCLARLQALAGGRLVHPPGGGQFYAPTVLAGVTPAMRIWREEVFGPVRGPALAKQLHVVTA